jgi:hypothetical protein
MPENAAAAAAAAAAADFGLAVNHMVERPVTRLGTLDYMAPEVRLCYLVVFKNSVITLGDNT